MIGSSVNPRTRRITSVPSRSGRPEVEEHELRRALGGADHRFLAGADGLDLVAVGLQARPQRSTDLRFVVDDEDPVHAGGSSPGISNATTQPPPGLSSIQIRPPWATTTAFEIARPSPLPGVSGIDEPR